MDEVIIKYKAEIDGYKAELEDLKKADKNTRAVVEKPIEVTADTKSLRAQLREAQADVARLSDKFGVTSKEAANAAKRAAELKDAIGDAKALTDAFNPDAKFNALTSSLGGVIGGFQAYEGALALVGGESEDLQKTLVKLNALMSLSQGLQQIGEARDSFRQLGAVIKNTTVFQTLYNAATRTATAVQTAFGIATTATSTGFKVLRGAIAATGIGALVIALGLVIANFDTISKWIKSSPLGGFANQVGNLVQRFTDFVGVTSQAERNLEKISKANTRANEGIKNKIDLLKAQGGSEKEIYQLSKQLNENELNTLRQTLTAKGKLNEEEAKNFRDLKNAQLVLDAEYNAKLKEDAKKAADKAKEDAKKALEDAKKAEQDKNEDILKKRDEALKKVSDAEVKAQRDLVARLEAENAPELQIEQAKLKLIENELKYNNQLLSIRTVFSTQLANVYTDTKQKELDAIKEGNAKLEEESKRFANEQIKLEIQQAISSPDLQTAKLENLKKQLQVETGLTAEEANKRKIELLRIDEEIFLSKMQNNDREIQALLQAQASYDGELVQSRLKANEELNQSLIEANKARIAEEEKQEKEAAEKRKQLLKSQLDELFAFASSGILLQIGLNPQALAKVKSDIESAIKTFENPNASDWERASAVATAATSTVIAAVDTLTANEKAASEQRITQLNTEKEAEIAAAGENEEKKAIIRQKYDQKIKAEKRKQFEAEKRASILRVIMTTAEAVIKAVAASPMTGGLPFSAIAAAIGAAQIALIASQPTPKFKDGVVGFNGVVGGVGTGTSDSNLAWLSKGESVIPAQATGQNLGLVSSLVNGDVDKYIKSHYILPAIEQKEAEVIQRSQKRIDDIESKIINKTISRTLEAMRKDNKVNTNEIVTAIKKDKFTL
jgi:hypothetical protein